VGGGPQHPRRISLRLAHLADGRTQLWFARLALRAQDIGTRGFPLHPYRPEGCGAFAWRTLIAAELVFGVASGKGGLGWFIYESRTVLDIPAVFAGLLTVIVIGLMVENLGFRLIERRTVRRWGVQS
jgi:hypothetical protein